MIRIQKNTTFINVKQKKFCFIEDRIFFTEPIDDCEYFVTLDMHVTKKKALHYYLSCKHQVLNVNHSTLF